MIPSRWLELGKKTPRGSSFFYTLGLLKNTSSTLPAVIRQKVVKPFKNPSIKPVDPPKGRHREAFAFLTSFPLQPMRRAAGGLTVVIDRHDVVRLDGLFLVAKTGDVRPGRAVRNAGRGAWWWSQKEWESYLGGREPSRRSKSYNSYRVA